MIKKGNVFVISGPSGVGKGTLLNKLLQIKPEIKVSVSATTRAPRNGEVNGVNYFFTTKENFKNQIDNGEFIEWAEFAGNYYGTYFKTVQDAVNKGIDIALEIEVQGAMQIRKKIPEAVLIFILPPSFEELKNRLMLRNTETTESMEKRLSIVKKEIETAEQFDYKVVNNDLEVALNDLSDLISKEQEKVKNNVT